MGLKPVSVKQLNNYIGRVLKTDPILGNFSVIGEISNLKFHSSGHVYFSLKDEESKINCFLSHDNFQKLTCSIEGGMEIIANGFISVYERGGYYSLNIRSIEVNGAGQLAIKFEKLKAKLSGEGLFSEDNKKPIPTFPNVIAIVTSETGAAVRDIIRTIRNKNDYVDILLYPVTVQGPQAAESISTAIDVINCKYKNTDVIITGRGGGSMEELWAFNEEKVARSIFASQIPVISAVGHETDFTIADFVADLRAATPTAAAQAAAPDIRTLEEYIDNLKKGIVDSLNEQLTLKNNIIKALDPLAFANNIAARITYEQVNADRIVEGMRENLEFRLNRATEKIEMLKVFIDASNPKAILKRGYSVLKDSDGNILNSTKCIKEGQSVKIETASGSLEAEVTKLM